MDWQLKPEQTVRRSDLHAQYGGSNQGGICPSRTSANLFIFTDPAEGEQHGYFDDWREDGLFHYTGHGRTGDQQMTRGNAAILNHKNDGRAIRLFYGARGKVRYGGQFETDSAKPYYHSMIAQRGSSKMRKVIIFRLRRIDVYPGEDVVPKPSASSVIEVPIEAGDVEVTLVHTKAEVRSAIRLERKLVRAFGEHALKSGGQITRHKMCPSGEARPLFSDAYDKARNLLLEAKSSVTREAIRMAIGQLADYSRFIKPKPQLAVLLPLRPPADLEELLRSQGICAVWQDEECGFTDNADGAFTWITDKG